MTTRQYDGVVVDTNVLSYIYSPEPFGMELAERYRPHIEDCPVAISFQTEGELRVALATQNLDSHRFYTLIAEVEIVDWSHDLLDCYVRIRAAAIDRWNRGGGPKIDAADGWVAAAALLLGRPLVTHDERLSKCPLIETITELAS